jgi:GT2 family glycosyltransferase
MISIVVISKDEPALEETLRSLIREVASLAGAGEIIVVDASAGRIDFIREKYREDVYWIDYAQPPGSRISIPQQRNVGVRVSSGQIVVFTDSGCEPDVGWLAALTMPITQEEEPVTSGMTLAAQQGVDPYGSENRYTDAAGYLRECSTINLAFRREVFDTVGGFDETFAYGSDVDFSWRVRDAGYKIRAVPSAIVRHDWGDPRRQRRRSYLYGKARARLYIKHKPRRWRILRDDPVAVFYPLFLLGLPLTFVFPLYPALLLIPAWRNRSEGIIKVLTDHMLYGAGVLAEVAGL